LAGASGGGMQAATAGVVSYAGGLGISAEAAQSLISAIGAGVAIAFADISGIGHDAGKFIGAIKEGAGSGKGDSDVKNVNDILDRAEETTRPVGKAKNYEKGGGYEQALKDFESLKPVQSKDIVTSYGNGKYGVLEDGTTVSVRPGSKTGGSTLEIHIPGKSLIKIRY
jgi:hypothetical protein